jgi:hypothetical protein
MCYINPRFRANSIEDGSSRVRRLRTIERCHSRCNILKNIGIIEAIWILKEGVFAGSGREVERGGMLGDTVDMAMVREIDVKDKDLGPDGWC